MSFLNFKRIQYAPKFMELAPRDIVARATQQEIDEGRGFEGGYVLLISGI